MRTTMRALTGLTFAAVILFSPLAAHSFDISKMLGNSDEHDNFKLIHVADLRALMAADGAGVHIYDANGANTRNHFGVIPGAVLLTSDNDYDLSVLPPVKSSKLVFYCADAH